MRKKKLYWRIYSSRITLNKHNFLFHLFLYFVNDFQLKTCKGEKNLHCCSKAYHVCSIILNVPFSSKVELTRKSVFFFHFCLKKTHAWVDGDNIFSRFRKTKISTNKTILKKIFIFFLDFKWKQKDFFFLFWTKTQFEVFVSEFAWGLLRYCECQFREYLAHFSFNYREEFKKHKSLFNVNEFVEKIAKSDSMKLHR